MSVHQFPPAKAIQPNDEERLIQFVSDRVKELGPDFGAAREIAGGTMAPLVSYAEIQPQLKGLGPDYSTGVADGLGQALRYIAGAWQDHPNFETEFAVQTPAKAEDWTR
ncbi:hypothetical protein AB0K86_19935 [Streptomyces clavifer]|uniref:hypothetical protein n=1 Tax=Streptomyces clavifer TaxID=68188 RepID=UPI0034157F04